MMMMMTIATLETIITSTSIIIIINSIRKTRTMMNATIIISGIEEVAAASKTSVEGE